MSAISPNVSLPELFRLTASQYPNQVAINFSGTETSFSQLNQLSDQVAAGLAADGIVSGDHIALYCVNSDVFVIAYMGILKAGATVVPINLLLQPVEIEYILNDAEVKAMIYHEAFAASVSAFRNNTTSVKLYYNIGPQQSDISDIDWQQLLSQASEPPSVEINPQQQVASILYTSGTTGKPKGAMLTHQNLAADVEGVRQALDISSQDRFLVVLPMFHAFAATVGMIAPLLTGATILPVPKFEPDIVATTVGSLSASIFLGVPSIYNVMLNMTDDQVAKFKTLRVCISGGAAMPAALMKKFEQRFSIGIMEGDGPTECGPVTCVNPLHGTRKATSVGLPIAGVEMSIRDIHGHEVPREVIAEICVRGKNVMKGYWKNPVATSESFFADWFRTGDLGYEDKDGYFYIVDRIKDMIIVNGMNVYPRVVEEVLYQHEAISEAAVIGEPNELHGETVVACIALKPSYQAEIADIRAFCRERLGKHQVPRKIFVLESLPKNAAGKILKRELRKNGELERGVDSRVEA